MNELFFFFYILLENLSMFLLKPTHTLKCKKWMSMISTIIISWWLLWETINRLWWHWWEGETGGARAIFANSKHCVFLFTNYNLIMDLFCTWVCFLIIVRLAGDNCKFALYNYACVEDKPKAKTVC